MEQRNTTVAGTTNERIFLAVNRYSLCTAHTYIQNKMEREAVHTSQTESGGQSSVWSRRVTALGLEKRLKKMFVVFLSVLIVSNIGSGMGILEHGQVQVGQSTLNLSLQKGNDT